MKVIDLLKNAGIDNLLDKFNNNLKMIKDYIIRECKIINKNKVNYVMKLIKKRQKERLISAISKTSIKNNVLKVLKEEF